MTVLKKCIIFHNIDAIEQTLKQVQAYTKTYKKGETIVMEGDKADKMGIVLEGMIRIVRDDIYGNRTIVEHLPPAHIFGETFACSDIESYPVSVEAVNETKIMFIRPQWILASHPQLSANLLRLLADKNLGLNQKLSILSKRSTKEKLMAYLQQQAKQNHSNTFDIPFNRQELADYLSVDRSALSSELSKLEKAGILTYKKNHFELK